MTDPRPKLAKNELCIYVSDQRRAARVVAVKPPAEWAKSTRPEYLIVVLTTQSRVDAHEQELETFDEALGKSR